MKVMVTGSNGFVGRRLVNRLIQEKHEVVSAVRFGSDSEFVVGDIGPDTYWCKGLEGVDVVLHLAAKVHVMKNADSLDQSEYSKVNTLGTLNLARQSVASGVKRFIFISTIKVNGEATQPDLPFRPGDVPAPQGPYAVSKWEAEKGLLSLSKATGLEVVIIRPPLVYGPGVRANFLSMLRLIGKGLPIPLKSTHNKRSLVALDNLVDLITLCVSHERAKNQVFLVSDGEDLSTGELLIRAGRSMGKRALLIPFPTNVLSCLLKLIGKRDMASRLLGNLQVDISKTYDLLNWRPVIGVDEGLRRAVSDSNLAGKENYPEQKQ